MRLCYWIGLIGLVTICFCSCKNSPSSHVGHEHELVLSKDVPADFLQSYLKFFSDTTYQKNHIVFPLKMKADGTSWLKENWKCHVAFSDDDGQLKQEFHHVNGLVLESISDDKNLFRVERRYIKTDDGYDLIYYTKQNAFENTEGWEKG